MEWTLDQDGLRQNPFNTVSGQAEIRKLAENHHVTVFSASGDCFMQAPFYKKTGRARAALLDDFHLVMESCVSLGLHHLLMPLVDDGRIDSREQEDDLVQTLRGIRPRLEATKLRILFESDFPPAELARMMKRLPEPSFGINYDIGNSASLGYRPDDELAVYGDRVCAVHVKDRLLGGTTVPLGSGNADLPGAFRALARAGFSGDYILQTARAADGRDAETLCRYRDMVLGWLTDAGPQPRLD